MASHNPSIGGYVGYAAAAAVGGLVAYKLAGNKAKDGAKDQGFDPEGWPTEKKTPEMEVAYQRVMLPDDANPHGVSPFRVPQSLA